MNTTTPARRKSRLLAIRLTDENIGAGHSSSRIEEISCSCSLQNAPAFWAIEILTLLFNKNRSLYKIIATQAEKDDLIHQEILPYSYRSRQIAIVTARSMFRQFGSRLIANGRRVRDDYWESKARKQGFTEEDAAGEKRPGAAKAREAAAAEASHAHSLTSLPHGEIIYSNGPTNPDHRIGGINPATLAPLPMINLAPMDDLRLRDYSSEILNQAAQIAEFNKALRAQRSSREQYLNNYWKRPHEAPVASPQRHGIEDGGINQISNFSFNTPRFRVSFRESTVIKYRPSLVNQS